MDFDLVKTYFAKLSKNESLISGVMINLTFAKIALYIFNNKMELMVFVSQVVKVVEQMLPSLNPNPTGVESLRVYLLLPELIRRLKKQQRTELTEALASKILQLDPDSRTVLGKAGRTFQSLCCCPCCICLSIFMLYSQRRTGPNSLMVGSKAW